MDYRVVMSYTLLFSANSLKRGKGKSRKPYSVFVTSLFFDSTFLLSDSAIAKRTILSFLDVSFFAPLLL